MLLLPAVEELCIELSRAIEIGDTHAAVHYATDLARQQIALTIQPMLRDTEDREIRYVCDCSCVLVWSVGI